MDELSEEDKLTVSRARKVQRFLSQSFHVAEQFTGMPGQYVPLKETLRGFRMILNGECDDLRERLPVRGHHRRCVRQGEERVNHDDLSSDGGHAGRLCL